jgi:glucan 1,3-beta-glucosidase
LQAVINSAAAAGKIVFFDAGTYRVTSTLQVPPGSKLVGEAYSVIMSSGSFFNNINNPQPVVRVGTTGQTGQVEWSDMIVATQGTQAGAVLIEVSFLVSPSPEIKNKKFTSENSGTWPLPEPLLGCGTSTPVSVASLAPISR